MAELMVGLAKSVVVGALSSAQLAIDEESKLWQRAQRDLVLITLELQMIYSFLDVADEQRFMNNLVRTWVRQVREMAYRFQDCIEFVVHLDSRPKWWLRLLPSFMASSPLPLDQAVAEIEELKTMAEELSKYFRRYSRITDSEPKLVMMQQDQASGSGGGHAAATAVNMLIEEARDTWRKKPCILAQLVTRNDDDLQVISVWETYGHDHGTTPVIRDAYNDPSVISNFTCRAWVKLMHPFSPHDFIRSLVLQFFANSCKEQEGASVGIHVMAKMEAATSEGDVINEFEKLVTENRYLVILEGLAEMVEWDAISTFFPNRKNGSWIIVPTQRLEIASMCIGHSYKIMELKRFSVEHSVCALFKKDSQVYQDNEDKSIKAHAGQIFSNELICSSNRKAVAVWMKTYPLVGRESLMNELRSCTSRASLNNSQVIWVWGIAGIGKSALVRNFYYDAILNGNHFTKYSWVDISLPFNLLDFCRSLFLDIHSKKDPVTECREFLRQHRCLIVIDSLQSKEEWDLIHAALVSRPSRSVIIAITTEANVANYSEDVFNVKGLEADAAFDLFRKEVHRKSPSYPINHLVNMEVDELIWKCGGLPKMIVAIAGLLATQSITFMDSIRSLNDRFIHDLETNPDYDSLHGIFGWMRHYINTCPDALKPCIFYLSVFPRHGVIRRRRLVRRWIAEGYCRDGYECSAEDNGEEFFSKLVDLSMIQQQSQLISTAFNDTRMTLCQVNGFILEYTVSRRVEENLVFELSSGSALTTQRTGRHLIILKGWDRDRIVFESTDFSRLRSLTVFGLWKSFFISKNMKILRVLDLEDALDVRDVDVEKMVKVLRRLKFLSLRGCHKVCHLPSSIGDLRQLQTLDVRGTSIANLPASITKLQHLQYIRSGTTTDGLGSRSTPPTSTSRFANFRKGRRLVGVEVPRRIGKLTALHTLGVVNVTASGGNAMLKDLKKLTQLRKLGVSAVNRHNIRELFSSLSYLIHLVSLSVQIDEGNQGCLDGISLPCENLQSLKLYGIQDKLPLSMSCLSKLRKLDLEMTTIEENSIEFLAMLPKLSILRLCVKKLEDCKLHFYASMVGCELRTFEKVKILEIACSSSRLHITFGSESMRNLEVLTFDCASASYQISGLNHLRELKQVLLKGAGDETLKRNLESQLAEHPNTPVVKLEELPRY